MNLNKYRYSHAEWFAKNKDSHWAMMNFKGEVYEASFYERLVGELARGSGKEFKLVAKGPYSQGGKGNVKTGFFNDKNGSLVYSSDFISFAEFDCLTVSESSVVFYECTLTKKPENLRSLKLEAIRNFFC